MEEELVRPLPSEPKWNCPAGVLRLAFGWRWYRGKLRKRFQWENQEAGQEDHPLVGVHLHSARSDGELSQRKHGSVLRGNERQDARVCCREERGQGVDGHHVWHRISGMFEYVKNTTTSLLIILFLEELLSLTLLWLLVLCHPWLLSSVEEYKELLF